MHIILLPSYCSKKGTIELCLPQALAALVGMLTVFGAALLWGGYELGQRSAAAHQGEVATRAVRRLLADEREVVDEARRQTQADLDALAMRIGALQARVMRLDAVGERMVALGKLDQGEFDFQEEPAMGGEDVGAEARSQDAGELAAAMQQLSAVLDDRERKLALLEDLLMNRQLLKEVMPSGRPVKSGWISSGYGRRTDPFTGKKVAHHGVDFAGKKGSDVMAVASGVVTRSETAHGYGKLVEIRHTDGYSTRYAHNQKILVKKGDVVSKGQVIALLGSTGRSSGPHVHFEVRKDGHPLNPRRYIRAD